MTESPSPAGLFRPASRSRGRIGALLLVAVAANAALGAGISHGKVVLALFAAALPLLILTLAWLLTGRRHLLVYLALALPMTAVGHLNNRLPGTGGTAIFPADLFVVLTLAMAIVAGFASPDQRARSIRTPLLGWPLALFAVAVLVGVFRGHQLYGEHYLDQATRMIIYAGIAPALAGLSPERAYRVISRVFYFGIVVQVMVGLYYLGTGSSQTASVNLSTGGTRALALTTAIWLGAGLVAALLNLERAETSRQRLFHLGFAGLAFSGIVISFSRTTFVAAGLLVPVLFLLFRRMRRSVLAFLPLMLPVALVGVAIALQVSPSLGTTLVQRLSGTSTNDPSVIQRERKWSATLAGFGRDPLFGLGFGRPVQFTQIDGRTRTINGDPENSYVWMLAGGGIAAFGSFMILMVVFFADTIRRAVRASGDARALCVLSMSLVFILLVNATTYPLLSSPPELLGLWIALLLPRLVVVPPRRRREHRLAPGM